MAVGAIAAVGFLAFYLTRRFSGERELNRGFERDSVSA
jgi:hypothetical protein